MVIDQGSTYVRHSYVNLFLKSSFLRETIKVSEVSLQIPCLQVPIGDLSLRTFWGQMERRCSPKASYRWLNKDEGGL